MLKKQLKADDLLAGLSYEDKYISLDSVHANLVISHHRLSSQTLAGFIRFGYGMIKGILVLDGI